MLGNNIKAQSGIALYLAIVIMTILLAIGLSISTIFLSQIKTTKEMGYSVIAFYAADTGIEKALTQRSDPTPLNNYSATLSNGASYTLSVSSGGSGTCPATNSYCIKSIGSYQETRRAIEITY